MWTVKSTFQRFERQISFLNQQYDGFVYRLNTPNFTISSGQIRSLVAEQKSVRYMLPDPVLDYIQKHRLYQGERMPGKRTVR